MFPLCVTLHIFPRSSHKEMFQRTTLTMFLSLAISLTKYNTHYSSSNFHHSQVDSVSNYIRETSEETGLSNLVTQLTTHVQWLGIELTWLWSGSATYQQTKHFP